MEFATKWRGLRFADPAVEADYSKWADTQAIPFIRVGMLAAAGTYFLATMVGFAMEPLRWGFPAAVTGLTIVPLSGLGAVLASRRYSAAINAVAGFQAIYVLQHLGGVVSMGLAQVMIVAFYGTTILRVPPVSSAVALGLYLGAEEVWLAIAPGELGSAARFALIMPPSIYVVCLSAAIVLDLTSRKAFQQERTIAELQGLLRQEISHQVAERSKSLGEQLAKADVALPAVRLEAGQTFADRYAVVRPLGRGGMGAVYEVQRLTDRQRLALKVVTGAVTGAQAARFAREAEIGARLRHPHLVSIVDVGVSGAGTPYLVMELVEGGGLEDHRARFGDRPWATAVLKQIAAGIAALHEAGVVHRDLKPANVLLAGDVARISDFGISRLQPIGGEADPLAETAAPQAGLKGPALTQAGALIGTPLYMPPEAARGGQEVDKPGDIFAFGIVAFELMTGRLPFEVPVVLEAMAGRPLPVASVLDGPLGGLVGRCLAHAPAERPTIAQVCAALA